MCFRYYFLKILFIFRERAGKEKNRERNISQFPLMCPPTRDRPATEAGALIGNRTGDLLLCRTMLNELSHTSQGEILLVRIRKQLFLLAEVYIGTTTKDGEVYILDFLTL